MQTWDVYVRNVANGSSSWPLSVLLVSRMKTAVMVLQPIMVLSATVAAVML